jgi:hypothetical protein
MAGGEGKSRGKKCCRRDTTGKTPADLQKCKSSRPRKNILLSEIRKMWLRSASRPHEGRFAIVTKRGAGCDGRVDIAGERYHAYGQAVWSRPLDAGVKFIEMRFRPCGRSAEIDKRRWLTSPTHRGERGAAAKTIAQGVPDRFGQPVATMPEWFFIFHPGLRVRPAPGIPCALCFDEGQIPAKARANFAAGTRLDDRTNYSEPRPAASVEETGFLRTAWDGSAS